jgi:hypothetical protein
MPSMLSENCEHCTLDKVLEQPTIFQQLYVCAHLCDLLDVHHDEALHLRILLLVKPTIRERHDVCMLLLFS